MTAPFRWTEAEVIRALGSDQPAGDLSFERVLTDSRAIGPGDLFIALRGDRFDAHDFLDEVANAGATGAIVSRIPEGATERIRLFLVPDTRAALGALGRHRRRAFAGKVVGVAGSNGKTTTKDLLRAALGARFRVHATKGNLNNQIGVPLTLLGVPDDAEVMVVEMGTNEPGEIRTLGAIVEPDSVIITSIGEEHLEGFGDLAGVLEEEISVLEGLQPEGTAVVAEAPPELPERTRERLGRDRTRVGGFGQHADIRPDGGEGGVRLLPDGTTEWSWRGIGCHLPLRGRHNVRNALLALGLAVDWGVEPAAAVGGLERMPVPKLRGEWLQIGDTRLIVDCYNSNPTSLSAAIELLASLPASGAKVAVVGTMRELGPAEGELHARAAGEIAGYVKRGAIQRVVATGIFADAFAGFAPALGDRLIAVPDPVEAHAATAPTLRGDETVLLKASRGEALERWIPLLGGPTAVAH